MPLPKKTKIIIAITAFFVLAALIGGSLYFKNKKASAVQKIGAEETTTSTPEGGKVVCLDCQQKGEEPVSSEQPTEPLALSPNSTATV